MLFTPGPVDVHPDVLAASAQPPLHHRSPEFVEVSRRVWQNLGAVMQTSGPVVLQAGSAMTGIESAIASLHRPGDTVAVFSHGRFGDRLRTIAERYGLSVVYTGVEWGQTITPELVAASLEATADLESVWLVHAETSTGVALDLPQVTDAIRRVAPTALIGVDVVTSLGVQPFAMEAWGIDVAVAGLQKGLACMPGLSVTAVSQRAIDRSAGRQPRTYTLDLHTVLEHQRKGLFAWTPPVTIVAALDVALRQVLQDGLETRWHAHRIRHDAITDWAAQHGVDVFGDASAIGVVALQHDQSTQIRNRLLETFGLHVAGGQDQLSGRLVRIGTMGYRQPDDLPTLFHALDQILKDL